MVVSYRFGLKFALVFLNREISQLDIVHEHEHKQREVEKVDGDHRSIMCICHCDCCRDEMDC